MRISHTKDLLGIFTTSQLSPALEIEELLNMPAVMPRKIAVLMSEVRMVGDHRQESISGCNQGQHLRMRNASNLDAVLTVLASSLVFMNHHS